MADSNVENTMKRILASVGDLPPLPMIASRVLNLVADPYVDIDKLSGVISNDQALTAKVLRISNSAYFGLSRRILTVKDAVITLGINNVRNQVLALSAQSIMSKGSGDYATRTGSLWEHSLATAVSCRKLAQIVGLKRLQEEAFIGGLLHDIGKSVLSIYIRERYDKIMFHVKTETKSFIEAEVAELGFDHAEIGARLAIKWNLPDALIDMIGDHHDPDLYGPNAKLVSFVHIANAVSSMLGISLDVDSFMNHIEEGALECIGANESMVEEVMAFISDIKDIKAFVGI